MNALFLVVLAASPADRLVVVNKTDSTVSVLERDSGKSVAVIPVGKTPHEVAVTPDSKWAFTSDYDGRGKPPGHTVTVVDLVKLEKAGVIELSPNSKPHGIAVSSDGKWLWVTCEGSSTVLKISVETRKIEATIDTGDAPTHLVALDEKNRRAYATSIDAGKLVVIDTEKAAIVKKVPCGKGAEGIDSTSDGKYVLVSNGGAGTLTVIDSAKLEPVKTIPVGRGPYRVRALPDAKRALVPNIEGGDMAEVDLAKLSVARRLTLGKEPIGVVVSSDSKRAWVASSGSDVIHVVDLEAWKTLGTLTAGKEPDGMAFVKAVEVSSSSGWDFDGERAHVLAHGEAKDALSSTALQQLGVKLDGDAYFKVSAHPNSVGGVTLKLEDYNDAKSACELYAAQDGDRLKFDDARCSFPAFAGAARTTATCRKIRGSAWRLKQGIALEAASPDCTAQPGGFSLAGKASVKPFEEPAK